MLRFLALWALLVTALCLTGPNFVVVWTLGLLCSAFGGLTLLLSGHRTGPAAGRSTPIYRKIAIFFGVMLASVFLASIATFAYLKVGRDPIGQPSDEGWGNPFPLVYHDISETRNGDWMVVVRRADAPWAGDTAGYYVLVYKLGSKPTASNLVFREESTPEGFFHAPIVAWISSLSLQITIDSRSIEKTTRRRDSVGNISIRYIDAGATSHRESP